VIAQTGIRFVPPGLLLARTRHHFLQTAFLTPRLCDQNSWYSFVIAGRLACRVDTGSFLADVASDGATL
jgi:hypothetical protein